MAINVGNLVVKNSKQRITEQPTAAREARGGDEEELIARFYKNSRYMSDMINN
jgi:hypothetical protein